MNRSASRTSTFRLAFLIACLTVSVANAQESAALSADGFVEHFRVLGPFQDDEIEKDDLASLMETRFLENERQLPLNDAERNWVTANTGLDQFLNLNDVLSEGKMVLAYAQCEVASTEAKEVMFLISAADGAKVFLNGENVHSSFGGMGRNYLHFPANLRKGQNNIVIKVPNRGWDWRVSVRILDVDQAAAHLAKSDEQDEYIRFLNCELQIKTTSPDPRLRPGRFPDLEFDNPELASKHLGGSYRIDTRWFDRELNEVRYPRFPGRYAYYAEIRGANEITLKKSATLFCSSDWRGQFQRLNGRVDPIALNDIPADNWNAHKRAIGEFAGTILQSSMMQQGEGSVLLAFADEVSRHKLPPGPITTPRIINGDFHAQLKQKILGLEGKFPPLKAPVALTKIAPVLRQPAESEMKKHALFRAELTDACDKWIDNGGIPFDIVVAWKGDILFHDVFGEDGYGKFKTTTPTEIASITKLFTGLLFAQFVDQGIIGIDDPVGLYLPEIPTEGPDALTFRHCFTHTSGFTGHAMFDGVHNPWLENTLAKTMKEGSVGKAHKYNGMGYDLAGKAMEAVTGKSVFRLFREHLYDPLEMNDTVHDWDLGFSCQSTAYDMAKVGQMLLNQGSYGNMQFFTKDTYEKIAPTDLSEYYPGVDKLWGIGINYQDRNEQISKDVIGHGSATANTFWVSPEHELVITQSRRRGGRNFGPNFRNVMAVIKKHLVDQAP